MPWLVKTLTTAKFQRLEKIRIQTQSIPKRVKLEKKLGYDFTNDPYRPAFRYSTDLE